MPCSHPTIIACLALLTSHAVAAGNGKKDRPVKELMPWYHSSDELHAEFKKLVASCSSAGASAEMLTAGALDVVRVKAASTTSGTKAVFVFGEHARELISPESALGLVRSLCGTGDRAELAKQTLAKGVEFVIVPNANPDGRRAVEAGYYCKRTNEHGVDLNRNWGDEHRNGASEGEESFPGPQGFSEPETQALRDLVEQESPDVFLSVHSGSYLLGASPGYKESSPEDEAAVAEVLRPISDKYCNGNCPYGGLRSLLGYNAAGCDIDYVHENSGVPYAFTWEIYNGFAGGEALIQRRAQHSSREVGRLLRGKAQALLSVDSPLPEDDQEPQNCIQQFLPTTESQTNEVVDIWTGAFLDLASSIVDKKQLAACKAGAANGAPVEQVPGAKDCLSLQMAAADPGASPASTTLPTAVPASESAFSSTLLPTTTTSQTTMLTMPVESPTAQPVEVNVPLFDVPSGDPAHEDADAEDGLSAVERMRSMFKTE